MVSWEMRCHWGKLPDARLVRRNPSNNKGKPIFICGNCSTAQAFSTGKSWMCKVGPLYLDLLPGPARGQYHQRMARVNHLVDTREKEIAGSGAGKGGCG